MLFLAIERFGNHDMLPVYRRLREKGRALREGVRIVDSWVEANFARCFQLMECEDLARLQAWVLAWRGTGVVFAVVPLVPSATTRELVEPHLGPP